MYGINPKTLEAIECDSLPNDFIEITEDEFDKFMETGNVPEFSSNGTDNFSYIGYDKTNGEQTFNIDAKTGVGTFKQVNATDKMTAPTVPIDASNNVSTNNAVKDYVDNSMSSFQTPGMYLGAPITVQGDGTTGTYVFTAEIPERFGNFVLAFSSGGNNSGIKIFEPNTNQFSSTNTTTGDYSNYAWSNDCFIACPADGKNPVLRSTNGKTWTPVTGLPAGVVFIHPKWSNGIWAISSYGNNESGIYYSTDDGLSWKQSNLKTGAYRITSKETLTDEDNGVFFVAASINDGNSKTLKSYYSSNGIDWTQITTLPDGSWQAFYFKQFDIWVMFANDSNDENAYYSKDGMNWNKSNLTYSRKFVALGSAMLCYSKRIVVSCSRSLNGDYSKDTAQGIMYTDDGMNWKQAYTISSNHYPTTTAWYRDTVLYDRFLDKYIVNTCNTSDGTYAFTYVSKDGIAWYLSGNDFYGGAYTSFTITRNASTDVMIAFRCFKIPGDTKYRIYYSHQIQNMPAVLNGRNNFTNYLAYKGVEVATKNNVVNDYNCFAFYQTVAIPNGTYVWLMNNVGIYNSNGISYRFYIIQPMINTTNTSGANGILTDFKYPNGAPILSGSLKRVHGSVEMCLDSGAGGYKRAYVLFPNGSVLSSTPILYTSAVGGNTFVASGGNGFMYGLDEVSNYIGNDYRFFYDFDGRVSNIYKINIEDIEAIIYAENNYIETTEENYIQNQENIKNGCKFTFVPLKDNSLSLAKIPNFYSYWNRNTGNWEFNEIEKIYHIDYELKNLIDKYQVYTIPFKFNKLKPTQQEVLKLFLEECDNLLKHVTVDTKIPEIPDFLKEPTEPLESN